MKPLMLALVLVLGFPFVAHADRSEAQIRETLIGANLDAEQVTVNQDNTITFVSPSVIDGVYRFRLVNVDRNSKAFCKNIALQYVGHSIIACPFVSSHSFLADLSLRDSSYHGVNAGWTTQEIISSTTCK